MIKLAVAAGHGQYTAGKRTPDGEREWDFNNKVVRAFVLELANYVGVTVRRFDDPTGIKDIPLIDRTNAINAWGADYHIDFHHNALAGKWGNHTGVETFVYLNNTNKKSGALARALHPTLVSSYGLKDRGVKEGNLHMLRETKCPAILIEGGFMDSTTDIVKLRNSRLLDSVGVNLAQAFAKYAKLKRKPEPASDFPEPPPKKAEVKPPVSPVKKKDYEGHWAEASIKKAIQGGIVNGYTDGNFGPNDPLTRGQLVAVLDRLGLLDKKK